MRKRSLFITLLSIFLTLCFCLGALTACGENTSSEPIKLPPEETPKSPAVITSDDNDVEEDRKLFNVLFDPEDDYETRLSKLKAKWDEKEILEDQFSVVFTRAYTIETLYHDYVPEDFEDFKVSSVEEQDVYSNDWLRKKLAGETVNDYPTFNYSRYHRCFIMRLEDPSRKNVYDAVIAMSFKKGVLSAEPLNANPPEISWCTVGLEDPYAPGQWGLDKIEAYDAWDYSSGSGDVLVGVIDTGIDFTI